MKTDILHSKGSKELLGALGGMAIAVIIYGINNALPSSQISRALLIDPSAPMAVSGAKISVNEKSVNPETTKRLMARASQIAKQMQATMQGSPGQSASSEPPIIAPRPAVTQVVADHADRTAWLQMRAQQRNLRAIFDIAPHAGAPITTLDASPQKPPAIFHETDMTATPTMIQQERTSTPLPASGTGLNALVFLSFILAAASITNNRKKEWIAAFARAQ